MTPADLYTADPRSGKKAKLLLKLTYNEFLAGRYGVMDLAAVEICRENKLPIAVFDFSAPGALANLVAGRRVGTLIA